MSQLPPPKAYFFLDSRHVQHASQACLCVWSILTDGRKVQCKTVRKGCTCPDLEVPISTSRHRAFAASMHLHCKARARSEPYSHKIATWERCTLLSKDVSSACMFSVQDSSGELQYMYAWLA